MNRGLPHVSPSSINNFLGCNRKWWHEYVQRVRTPEHPAATLGKEMHDDLENWLVRSKEPTHRRLLPALDHFPSHGTGVELESLDSADTRQLPAVVVETWLTTDLGFVKFKGRADVIDMRDAKLPAILDLKTSGNLRYAKTSKDLLTDVQMVSYAYVLMQHLDALESVDVAHIYASTRGATEAFRVGANITRTSATAFWNDLIIPTAREMVLAYEEELATAVDPCKAACSAYGGCPHKTLCPDVWPGFVDW